MVAIIYIQVQAKHIDQQYLTSGGTHMYRYRCPPSKQASKQASSSPRSIIHVRTYQSKTIITAIDRWHACMSRDAGVQYI